MRPLNLQYTKSVYLFPAIDVSEDVNSLKQLYVIISLSGMPKIYFNEIPIIEIQTAGERYVFDWFGDCIEITDPITSEYLFVGFINNVLIGFGTIPLNINEKICKKMNIGVTITTPNLNIKGFGLSIPYKNYNAKFSFSQLLQPNAIDATRNIPNWENIKKLFKPSFDWKNNAPSLNYDVFKQVWKDSWVLYRLNTFYPEGPFPYKWISSCRNASYQYDKITMWDIIHIVEDLKWYDQDLSSKMLNMYLGMFRKSDGMIIQNKSCGDELDGESAKSESDLNKLTRSQPPIFSYTILELSKMTGNNELCNFAFENLAKNIEWWESKRYFPEYELFGYHDTPIEMGIESGLDNSPRFFNQFTGRKWNKVSNKTRRHLITVDLNSQMADYYQNVGVIASVLGSEKANDYFAKAERLIDVMQKYCWNEKQKFFFDYDVDVQEQQPIYSASHFFALLGGVVMKSKVNDFISHLSDPNKFWAELPIPSIALNSPFFSKDMWSGPGWVSQNYWIIIGLRRYNMNSLAAQIAYKCLKYLETTYDNYSKIFEYYNPLGLNQKDLLRKGDKSGPLPNYIGHFPIHSIFYYGLIGAEIIENNISFIPNWSVLKTQFELEFYYNLKKHNFSMNPQRTKLLELERS
jgi:hypothetical protein